MSHIVRSTSGTCILCGEQGLKPINPQPGCLANPQGVSQWEVAHTLSLMSARLKEPNTKFSIGTNIAIVIEGRSVIAQALRKFVQSHSESWAQYSGDQLFPVPSGKEGVGPIDAYARNQVEGALWDPSTTYGQLRLDLAQHIASNIDQCLEELAK